MQTLVIKYQINNHTVLLTVSQDSLGWQDICRSFLEMHDGINKPSGTELEVPWWVFINSKNSLLYLLDKHNFEPKLDKSIVLLLNKSKENLKLYNHDIVIHQDINESNIQKFLDSKGFIRTLNPLQIINLLSLIKYNSAADFSVPGAGKTTEALAFYTIKRQSNDKLLVVSPRNAFAVWEEEIQDCLGIDTSKILRVSGGYDNALTSLEKGYDIYLINYHFFPNIKSLLADLLSDYEFFMFLDESHNMKRGHAGVRGRAILELSHLPKYKLVLSGTPLPNSITDLIPQFSFLYPEILANKDNVVESIKPVYVRTTKKELPIPKMKPLIVRSIPLNSNQRRLYDFITSGIIKEAEELKANQRIRLRKLGRSAIKLLQLVSNPSILIDSEWIEHPYFASVLDEGDSPKIKYVCIRARQLAKENKKVIIWSNFVKNIELISSRLIDLGADYIYGQVETGSEEDENTREYKIKRFHDDDKAFVLVANPAACGESISLHKVCNYAIYLDRNYNAGQYLQSVDRIHRLGLDMDKEIIVELLISPDTIDISVAKRLDDKIKIMSEVLDDPGLRYDPIFSEIDDVGITYKELGLSDEDAEDLILTLKRNLSN